MSSQQADSSQVENPYVGPRSFTRDQFKWFKGRERESRELLSLLLARRLVLFYAQSGAGKTSLLNAGLKPALEKVQGGFEILPIGRVGDSVTPPDGVGNIFVFNLLMSLGISKQPEQIVSISLSQFLLDLVFDGDKFINVNESSNQRTLEEGGGWDEEDTPVKPRVLIIDQFEEIFTVHPEYEQDRIAFFSQLADAMSDDPYLYVMLSMRGDYVDRMSPYVHLLPNGLRSRYNMERMRDAAAFQAVSIPAAEAGREFVPEVARKLVNYLRRVQSNTLTPDKLDPYVETVQLQVVCMQLWQSLKDVPGEEITMAHVDQVARKYVKQSQQVGDTTITDVDPLAMFISTALASYYEQAISSILNDPSLPVIDEYRLRNWFSTELITESGTRSLLPRGEKETEGIPEAAVALLDTKHHIIRDDMRGGRPFIELVHDSFVDPIRQANRHWRNAQTHIIPWLSVAHQYSREKDPMLLLTGDMLTQAQQQAKISKGLSEEAEKFLKACEDAERERHLRESEKRTKILIGFVGVLVIVALTAIGLMGWGITGRNQANAAGTVQAYAVATATGAVGTAEAAMGEAENNLATATVAQGEAIVAAGKAATAEANADQQRFIAESLRLAGQSQEYLEDGNLTASLLLAVEANKQSDQLIASNAADQIKRDLTQDLVYGSFLLALNHPPVDSRDTLFKATLPAASLNDVTMFIPMSNELGALYHSTLITVSLPSKNITLTAVSPDGNYLAFANNKGGISVIEAPLITETPLLEFGKPPFLLPDDVFVTAMAFSQDNKNLAIAVCSSSSGSNDDESVDNREQCEVQLWELQDDIYLKREEQNCAFSSLERITSLVFLSDNSKLVWSTEGAQYLFIGDVQDQNCDLERIPLPHGHQVENIAYLLDLDDESNSTGLLITAGYPVDCPEGCGGSSQWWRVRSRNGDTNLTQLGSLLPAERALMTVQPIVDSPAIVTLNRNEEFTWYNANVTRWSEIACQLSGRNLEADEWQEAFLTHDFDDAFPSNGDDKYEHSCADEEYDYGLDISFAKNKLDEAVTKMKICTSRSRQSAANLFKLASDYENESNDTLIHEDSFESWGINLLLRYALKDSEADISSCFNQLTTLYQNKTASSLNADVLQEIVESIQQVDSMISKSYSSDSAQSEDMLDMLEVTVQQIAQLDPELQAAFNNKLVEQYAAICFDVGRSKSCPQLMQFADLSIAFNELEQATTEDQQMWQFDGQEGEIVVITMDAAEESDLDPELRLLNEDGLLVRYNDDSSGRNSFVVVELPETRKYFIHSSGWANSSGEYVLTVHTVPAISVGDNVLANTTDTQLWMLEGESRTIVSISMDAIDDSLNPHVMLFDADGNRLMEGDNSGGDFNSLIASIHIVDTGQYYIRASGLRGSSGAYGLTVTEVAPSPIEIGSSETSNTVDTQIWMFKGEAGDVISIELYGANEYFDPRLTLFDPQGDLLAENDDSGKGFQGYDALIPLLPLHESGHYIIRVGRSASLEPYTLLLKTVDQVVEEYVAAVQYDFAFRLESASEAYHLCWFGSLMGYAEEVLLACETAVSLDPNDGNIADSYGVALALLDNTEEAIVYFEKFITWGQENGYDTTPREEWVEELKNNNPFIIDGEMNQELLEYLRNE